MIKRRQILTFFFFVIALSIPFEDLSAQENEISGVVRDYKTNETLPGVNVFLDKTNRGTSTNKYGRFRLDDIPDGLYTVVASMVGYKKLELELTFPREKTHQFEFLLKPDTVKLKEVVVVENRPRKWLRNLEKFKEYFLGYTKNADKTKILNPEVLEFKSDNFFVATALKPLKIRNNALGYDITFFLDRLLAKDQILQVDGHSLYTERKPENNEQLANWVAERKRAYNGSYRHFIQSLNNDNYYAQGFRIYLTDHLRKFGSGKITNVNSKQVENTDQILTPAEPGQLALSTNGLELPYLRIEYTDERIERRLVQRKLIAERMYHQVSWMEFPRAKAVINLRSGGEVAPYRAILHGYWGFSNRIPDLLPTNYDPETHRIQDDSTTTN